MIENQLSCIKKEKQSSLLTVFFFFSVFQYSRRECIEVVGILNNINELEDKVLIVFQKLGCELSPQDLEACHRLRKNSDRVIVKFSRRKDCEQIMSIKKI